ncbi:MAG: tRNA epoxyqueuosine(34) reductase QueG [Muribaculaceae bacterium]|nr:tRNA epoxyqueuosine(34) reductase QueG [Muribaculaceae bacterium]
MEQKEFAREQLLLSGAVAVGFAEARPVDEKVMLDYSRWIEKGWHAEMDYLERHYPLKSNPESVLPGVRTVISLAFGFYPKKKRNLNLPEIASYALGDDYHDVLRKRLQPITGNLKNIFGGEWRICIDSAPLSERFWAQRSGIGHIGRNGMLIVDGWGSYVMLAEVLTSIPFSPDKPASAGCKGCDLCVRSCPGRALNPDGTIDCRRCISYLSIEHRGEWTPSMKEVMTTPLADKILYGCERCLSVCPHNKAIPSSPIDEFTLRDEYSSITFANASSFTQEQFSKIFKSSPIKRCKLEGFLRNARNLKP